jgi:outer membrane lipoprotein-sorting protein
MWIDPNLGVAIQQKFFQPEGDYRLTKYSDIRLNQKLPDNTFKLKTDSKTTTVSPQG